MNWKLSFEDLLPFWCLWTQLHCMENIFKLTDVNPTGNFVTVWETTSNICLKSLMTTTMAGQMTQLRMPLLQRSIRSKIQPRNSYPLPLEPGPLQTSLKHDIQIAVLILRLFVWYIWDHYNGGVLKVLSANLLEDFLHLATFAKQIGVFHSNDQFL